MALFDTVPRIQYEQAMRQLEAANARYSELVTQVVDMKRHEMGMNPTNFDPKSVDPMNGLGARTQMAIEEFASGDPELRRYLLVRAYAEQAVRGGMDAESRDEEVAGLIMAGDTA